MKKFLFIGFTLISVLLFNSCGKDDSPNSTKIESYDVDISSSQWVYDDLYERWTYKYYPKNDYFGSSIVGYVMSGAGQQIMPYETNWDWRDNFRYDFSLNLYQDVPYIEIQATNLNNKTIKPDSNEYFNFIFVSSQLKSMDIDWSNYNEVSTKLNLK